ncbi:hypothetical protein ADL35_18730 [Streptomyces sp. NRRL WC-3753]|nr:hypothetical protein ADL35_18730 [Streptomyces sp. NRRL WC-3753]
MVDGAFGACRIDGEDGQVKGRMERLGGLRVGEGQAALDEDAFDDAEELLLGGGGCAGGDRLLKLRGNVAVGDGGGVASAVASHGDDVGAAVGVRGTSRGMSGHGASPLLWQGKGGGLLALCCQITCAYVTVPAPWGGG